MSYIIALALGFAIVVMLQASSAPFERRYIWVGFAGHVFGSIGLLWLNATRGGDMEGYGPGGIFIADLVRQDPGRWFPEVVKTILGGDSALDVGKSTTGAMFAICALIYLLIGNSFYAACFFTGCLALVGQVLLYRVMSERLKEEERRLVAIACLLPPSVIFWTSGLIKEAFCVAGLGLLVHGAVTLLAKRKITGVVGLVVGGILVAAVKPYVLFPLVLGAAAWIFARRGGKIRLAYVVVALGIAVGGVAALGSLFPTFGVDRLGEQISAQQYYSEVSAGGSYAGGSMTLQAAELEDRDRSLAGQVKYLPVALANAMFRPFIFEARTAPQFAAAIETSILSILFLILIRRVKLRVLVRAVTASPILLASGVFVLTFGAAVGLSTQNMGTLSRYRVPMMPSLVTPMLLLWHRFRNARRVAAPKAAPLRPLPERRARPPVRSKQPNVG